MSLYTYVKEKKSTKQKAVHYFSYVSLTIGALLLFWSFYPVLSFEIYSRMFIQRRLNTPIPRSNVVSSLEQASSILGSYNAYSSNLRDFTSVDVWFPEKQQSHIIKEVALREYTLSIPKLNIQDARVIVGGEDLKKSLVHYLPETIPGEYGNIVIFGHSTLPQLYDPKNYTTIFTYLPSLEKGDRVVAKVNSVEHTYEVIDMFVVNPDQISVLEQKNDASYLTLITCAPPGTYWQRLVVKAKLTQPL